MCRIGILLLLVSATCLGQVQEGVVLDANTREPVPFASIGIMGTTRGTSSNLNGSFSLQVAVGELLQISCVGYQSMQIKATGEPLTVLLKPAATQLDEVIVSSKRIRPEVIIRRALARVGANFNAGPFLQNFFYRHYCKDNDVYGRLIEASVDVWKPRGYSSFQNTVLQWDQIRINQLRRSLDNTRMAAGHEPIAVNSILEADLAAYQIASAEERVSYYNNISRLQADLLSHRLEFRRITSFEGHDVYQIDYELKKDSILLPDGHYRPRVVARGTLYINTDDLAFIKLEEEKTYGNNQLRTSVSYRKYGEHYYPFHFAMDGQSQVGDNEKHVFHIELMSVEVKPGREGKFAGKMPSARQLLDIPYDSTFWATTTLLKTTPLEDEIIADLGGGVSLSKQFLRYRQYQLCVSDGQQDAESKLNWLLEDSRGNRSLYLIFCSNDLKSSLREIESAKRLYKQVRNEVQFIFVVRDEDEAHWKSLVTTHNLFADGIINYRISANSTLLRDFRVNQFPEYFLVSREGSISPAPKPSDPALIAAMESLVGKQ